QKLPPLPAAAFARRAAARARRGTELRSGVARVAGLDDLAVAAVWLPRQDADRAIGQGFRAVHLVELGLVNFGAAATRGPPPPSPPRKGGGDTSPAAAPALLHRACGQVRGLAIFLCTGVGARLGLHGALLHGGIVNHRKLGRTQPLDLVAQPC